MRKETAKKNRLVDGIEHVAESFANDTSVEVVRSKYKVNAHDNTLPHAVNDELDIWTHE